MAVDHQALNATWSRWGQVYVIVVLFLSTSAGGLPVVSHFRAVADPLAGDPLVQITWAILYLIAALLLFHDRRQAMSLVQDNPLIFILTGYACVSLFWSEVPQVTFRRIVALIGTTMVATYIGVSAEPKELFRLLVWVFGICAFTSIIVVLAFPEHGLQSYAGSFAWCGIYGHKNHLGRIMFLSSIVGLGLLLSERGGKRILFLILAVGSVALLFMSRSLTSVIALVAGIMAFPVLLGMKLDRLLLVSTATFLLEILVWILCVQISDLSYSKVDHILRYYLGRDITLSGRVLVWELSWQQVKHAFLLGHGYSAFWAGPVSPCAVIWSKLGRTVSHAHSGILDLWLELGLVGVAFYASLLIQYVLRLFRWVQSGVRFESYIFAALFLLSFFLINLVESMVLGRNYFFWIMFVTMLLLMSPNNTNITLNPQETADCEDDYVISFQTHTRNK